MDGNTREPALNDPPLTHPSAWTAQYFLRGSYKDKPKCLKDFNVWMTPAEMTFWGVQEIQSGDI